VWHADYNDDAAAVDARYNDSTAAAAADVRYNDAAGAAAATHWPVPWLRAVQRARARL